MKKRLFVLLLVGILVSFGLRLNNSKELKVSSSVEKELNESNEPIAGEPTLEQTKTITVKKETNIATDEEFVFRISAWKEKQDDTQYEYTYLAGAGGGDGDQDPDWSIYPYVTFTYQGMTFEQDAQYTMYREYGEGRWFGFNNQYVGPGYVSGVSYANRVAGIYDDALISLFESMLATPQRYDSDVEAVINGTLIPEDTGETITIQGKDYPLFAMGYNIPGNEHGYDVYYGELSTHKEYVDLSSYGGISDNDSSYHFTIKNGEPKTIEIPQGYTVEIEEISKDGWTLESINGNRDITSINEKITENKEYIFRNENPNIRTITIHHYKEGTTDKVGDDVILNKLVGENYSTEALSFVDNEVITPDNANGVVSDNTEVIYYYKEVINDTPQEEVGPPKKEKQDDAMPKVNDRKVTPNTVDKIIIDSELFIISILVMGICIMLIKKVQ